MSCHAIGHGINTIMEIVVDLFEEGKLPIEAVRRIGAQAMKAVNYCDGNAYEAIEVLLGYRCGRCLKKATDDKPLYSLYEINRQLWRSIPNPLGFQDEPLASFELCADCFDAILAKCTGDPKVAPHERKNMGKGR